jgi:hypothetical protein
MFQDFHGCGQNTSCDLRPWKLTRSLQPTTAVPFVFGGCRKFAALWLRRGSALRRLWLREVVRHRRTYDSLRTKTLNAPRIAGSCCRYDIRCTHARGGRSPQPAVTYAGRVSSRPLGGVHAFQPGPLFRFALGRLFATAA